MLVIKRQNGFTQLPPSLRQVDVELARLAQQRFRQGHIGTPARVAPAGERAGRGDTGRKEAPGSHQRQR